MPLNREAVISALHTKLGAPYLLGAKWDVNNPNPSGPIDCSGAARWGYARGGQSIPDGSYNIFALCDPIDDPLPADFGFFRNPAGQIDHIGLVYDDENMIEARGAPFNAVILRPRAKWEAWQYFTGYMRLRGI